MSATSPPPPFYQEDFIRANVHFNSILFIMRHICRELGRNLRIDVGHTLLLTS